MEDKEGAVMGMREEREEEEEAAQAEQWDVDKKQSKEKKMEGKVQHLALRRE